MTIPSLRLTGRSALVTGGGKGIGRAIALALSARGVKVVVTGRDEKALGETRDEGGRLLTVNQQHVAKAVAEERERCAKIADYALQLFNTTEGRACALHIREEIRGAK